ncbi:Uncharacterised protein [Clostridium botulinum]|nr:Uncharacterised protein [Clostridium botulinum]
MKINKKFLNILSYLIMFIYIRNLNIEIIIYLITPLVINS